MIEEHETEIKLKAKNCDYCKIRGHSTTECKRKIRVESKTESMDDQEKNTIKCYGCGKPGFIRNNCPDCKQKVEAASIELDFLHVMLTLEAPIPTVLCHINGLAESAFFDTAAKTSIVSEALYKRLLEKGCTSISKTAKIKQADGKSKQDTIKIIQAVIVIQGRTFNIKLVVLPDTDKNRTLLGIDFLEQSGIIISAIQRSWWFIDTPSNILPYESSKNYDTKENDDPSHIKMTTGPLSKSKKKRLRQLLSIKNRMQSTTNDFSNKNAT